MPKPKKPPSYLLHKASGQARVRIDGQDVYLGLYDSEESHEAYRCIVARWLATKGTLTAPSHKARQKRSTGNRRGCKADADWSRA